MQTQPSSQLNPSSTTVLEIFGRFFEIPMNQRTYQWSDDERKNLWDDICLTIESDKRSDYVHSIGHFLGTIVVIGKEQSNNQARLKIIDGQQRLTTITILLDCLRTYLEKSSAKIRNKLSVPLSGCLSAGTDAYPRIILNKDHEFFQDTLLEFAAKEDKYKYWEESLQGKMTSIQKNVIDAYKFFYSSINDYVDGDDYDDRVEELVVTILNSFYFLFVRTENMWMAYRLFETLNDRGLELSKADLIRNVVLENAADAGEGIVKEVEASWNRMLDYSEESDGRLELSQLIQFSYTHRYETVKKDEIFEHVARDLRQGGRNALELVREFEADARNWYNFIQGDIDNWSSTIIEARSAILNPLWKDHCVPYIMAVMDKYSQSLDELEKLLVLCEHYLFRQGVICRDSVASLQKFFGEASRSVRLGDDMEDIENRFKECSPDNIFLDNFQIASVANNKQGFYTIWKIEKQLLVEIDFEPNYQSPATHVEHIMPRKPDSSWGNMQEDDNFKSNLNRIGNLLILSSKINSHIKNKSIDYKISNEHSLDYTNSKLSLTKELVDNYKNWSENNKWTFDSIARRQSHLSITYALSVWSLG